MKVFGKEVDAYWFFLHLLIIVDLILITVDLIFDFPDGFASFIQIFDLLTCMLLLIDWFWTLYRSKSKKAFLMKKTNWIDLIASIPFDLLLPAVFPAIDLLRYFRLLKFLRIFVLFNRFFNGFEKFISKTNLDKILGGVLFSILFFSILLTLYGPNYNFFDSVYFVIVTLTTVGYGDITPVTNNEKIITIFLIFIGLFVFSSIVGVITSYFSDQLIVSDSDLKMDAIYEDVTSIKKELEQSNQQNQELKREIEELKQMIKEK